MSGFFRLLFLFSSFGPLYAIFAVKLHFNAGISEVWQYVFALFAASSVGVFASIAASLRSRVGTIFEVVDVKAKDSEIFSYLTTYIPPLIVRDMSKPEVYIPLMILYFVIGLAYFRLDSPYLNPYFILFGYRVYEARMKVSRALVTIISRGRRIAGTDDLSLVEVGNGDLYYCGNTIG